MWKDPPVNKMKTLPGSSLGLSIASWSLAWCTSLQGQYERCAEGDTGGNLQFRRAFVQVCIIAMWRWAGVGGCVCRGGGWELLQESLLGHGDLPPDRHVVRRLSSPLSGERS